MNRLSEVLGLRIPLIQAGMGGVAGVRLAAAVSEAGAGGVLGLYKLSPARIREVVKETAAATGQPFGVNVIPEVVGTLTVQKQLEAVVSCLPERGFVTFFGLPEANALQTVAGYRVVVQVGTRADADRAIELGADAVVLQGTEAGGHLLGDHPVHHLLKTVRDGHPEAVLVVAGGIATAEDLAEALKQGADGAMAGTMFVPAAESDAHPVFKRLVLEAGSQDTRIVETFVIGWPGRRHRVLKNSVTEAVDPLASSFIASTTVDGRRLPIARHSAATPTAETQGLVEEMALYCGVSCDRVSMGRPVAEILQGFSPGGDMIDEIVEWLHARTGRTEPIPADLDLIETRLIDSLSFMEFILLLEDVIGRELDPQALSVDQFRSLNAIRAHFLNGP